MGLDYFNLDTDDDIGRLKRKLLASNIILVSRRLLNF